MKKSQYGLIAFGVILFAVLYFGFSTLPPKQAEINQARVINQEMTDVNALRKLADEDLSADDLVEIHNIERKLQKDVAGEEKITLLKSLSGNWYRLKQYALAGFYAQKIAESNNTAEAWSISGTSYATGVINSKDKAQKSYCFNRAVTAFENASSLEPGNINHQVNLALCYVENPLEDQPMKGVMMMLDLLEKNPESVPVLSNLGRLGIRTGQFDKAIARLEKAKTLAPNNANVTLLLSEAYNGLGNREKAFEYLNEYKEMVDAASN